MRLPFCGVYNTNCHDINVQRSLQLVTLCAGAEAGAAVVGEDGVLRVLRSVVDGSTHVRVNPKPSKRTSTDVRPIVRCTQVLKPARRPRKKMVSFAGGFLFWQDPGGLRSDMRDLFQVPTHERKRHPRSSVSCLRR